MNIIKKRKYFLILANFKHLYIALLFIAGVFLFPNIAYLASIDSKEIIKLSNIERISNEQKPLSANQYLSQAAYNKAVDIFQEQRFEHNFDDRRFSAWIRDVNYKYKYVGENLAIDFVSNEGVVNAWIQSPTHYKNLINDKFTEIGVAVLEDTFKGKTSIIVVQIFGTPLEDTISLDLLKKENRINNDKINFLTHSNNDNLNIKFEEEIFTNLNIDNKANYSLQENNTKKMPDLFFTLIGFVYLGIFKLVSFKNVGL